MIRNLFVTETKMFLLFTFLLGIIWLMLVLALASLLTPLAVRVLLPAITETLESDEWITYVNYAAFQLLLKAVAGNLASEFPPESKVEL